MHDVIITSQSIYISFSMRQLNVNKNSLEEDDRFEINGWSNELDDKEAGSSLLKILEKKITFPNLENNTCFQKSKHKKLETLPVVPEYKLPQRQTLVTVDCKNKIQAKPLIIQRAHIESTDNRAITIRKSLSDKLRPVVFEPLREGVQRSKGEAFTKQHKAKQKNKSYLGFDREGLKKDSNRNTGFMHKASVEEQKPFISSLDVKIRLAMFEESSDKQLKQRRISKRAKFQRFLSQYKQKFRYEYTFQKLKVKNLKAEQKTTTGPHPDNQKIFKINKTQFVKKIKKQTEWQHRAVKTQTNDFMDEHLQAYYVLIDKKHGK